MKDSTFKKYCLMIDEWFVNGRNGTRAYQMYNPDSSEENAKVRFSEIVTISNVQDYIKSKEQDKSEELNITLTSQLKALDDIIVSAEKESDKINAIKEQNKLLALYREHNSQKAPRQLTSLIIKTVGKDN
jgi:phage terminase small subunit